MSVVSFHPVHQRVLGPDDNQYPKDPETGLTLYTLDQLVDIGTSRRYIDNMNADYSALLSVELSAGGAVHTKSPFTRSGAVLPWIKQPHVAVVGAGMGGLLTALQLAKVGMRVDVFEAGPAPYVNGTFNGAGRIAPALVEDDDYSQYGELGAMRFPTNSYLFWHYIKATGMEGGGTIFRAFPNPVKVPSLYTSQRPRTAGTISGMWERQYSGGDGLPSSFASLQGKHMDAVLNYTPYPTSPTLGHFKTLLAKDGGPDAADIKACKAFWSATRTALYTTSYRQFLASRKNADGSAMFTTAEIDEIGYLGIGTGGFGPLFSRCVLEIMRLFLWSYDTEVQVPQQRKYPEALRAAAAATNRVTFRYDTAAKGVAFDTARLKWSLRYGPTTAEFDYLVLAMTSQAAKRLLAGSEAAVPRSLSPTNSFVYPFYDSQKPFHSDIKRDLENQNGMDSIKIFQTIYGPGTGAITRSANNMGSWQLVQNPNGLSFDRRVRVAYGQFHKRSPGQTNFGTSFTLPMVHSNRVESFAQNKTVLALHYSWGAPDLYNEWPNDLDDISGKLFDGVSALNSIGTTGKYAGQLDASGANNLRLKLWNAMVARFGPFKKFRNLYLASPVANWANFFTTDSDTSIFESEGLNNVNRSVAIVYWSKVPYVWMGFKLDRPGFGAHQTAAHRISRYGTDTTTAWDQYTGGRQYAHPAVRRLYFAGDAASNYGGWVEGAFQGALSASASLINHTTIASNGFLRRGSRSLVAWTPVNALSRDAYAPSGTVI